MGLFRTARQKHLDEKTLVTQKKIWDLEFLLEKMGAMREGFRVEFDRLQEQVDAANLRLDEENKKEDPDATIRKNLTNLIERYTPDIEQLKKQIEGVDSQIHGPDGIEENIEGLHTVIGMLREHRKKVK